MTCRRWRVSGKVSDIIVYIVYVCVFMSEKVSVHCMCVCVRTVSPDAIHEHVKTKIEGTKRMHYTAPEYAGEDRDS